MHVPRGLIAVLASVLAFTFLASPRAQILTTAMSFPNSRAYIYTRVPAVPSTITEKTTDVQKLSNGVTITHEAISKAARDSSGRTYTEIEGASDIHFMTVNDPVNRTSMHWTSGNDSGNKVVTIFHLPESHPISPSQHQPATARPVIRPQSRTKSQTEDLGTKTILGFTVRGQRTTETIPTGSQGNDQPFNTTVERWYSPSLGMPLLIIRNDPRTGTTTWEVTDIELGEPNSSLFQIPQGYTIKDIFPQSN